MERMGITVGVEPNLDEGTMYVDVLGSGPDDEDMGVLIGRHGQTLEALQEITRLVVSQRLGTRCRVMVDVEDYRKRRRSHILRRAREAARRVRKTGQPESLDPMTAFERKIVHDAIADLGGLDTASEGEEPNRRVVITRRQ